MPIDDIFDLMEVMKDGGQVSLPNGTTVYGTLTIIDFPSPEEAAEMAEENRHINNPHSLGVRVRREYDPAPYEEEGGEDEWYMWFVPNYDENPYQERDRDRVVFIECEGDEMVFDRPDNFREV